MPADKNDQDMEALRADMEALKKDLAAVTKSLSDLARHRVEGLRDSARTQAEQVRDDIDHFVDDLGNRGRRQVDRLEHEVASRPLFSLLTAFGIGLLIGKLLDRR